VTNLARIEIDNEQRREVWERMIRSRSLAAPIDYQTFSQAYHLAWFIHRDKPLALRIVEEAIASLEVYADRQYKRRAKDPQKREVRNQILLSQRHLFQLLVCLKSGGDEEKQEQIAGAALSEEDMIVRYVEHLASLAFNHNPYYAALGMAGLLHSYPTADAIAMHDWADPERVCDVTYWHGCKRTLLKGLENRFGQRLRMEKNARGELPFKTQKSPERYAKMIAQLLRLLAPWGTNHVIPEYFDPFTDALPELTFQSDGRDGEPEVEINRMHAFLDPCCFERLAANFGFDHPAQRLALPRFFLTAGAEDEPPRGGGRNQPPPLNLEDLVSIGENLAEQKSRRKRAVAARLAAMVDGVKRAEWDLLQVSRVKIEVGPEDRLLEIIAPEQNLLLASCLLAGDDPEPARAATTLEGGQSISFTILPARDAEGQTTGASVEIVYRETNPWRAVTLFQRRLKLRDSREFFSLLLKPALALAIIALCVIGLVKYLQSRNQKVNQPLVVERKQGPPVNERQPQPSPPALRSPASSQTPRRPKHTLPPKPELARKTDTAPPEDNVEDVTRRMSAEPADVTLDSVKKVYIDPLGTGRFAQRVRARLIEDLRKSERLVVAGTREQADAVLKGKVERQQFTALLVNRPGKELWKARLESSARKPEEVAAALSAQVVRDLLDKINQAEQQGAKSK